MKRPAVFFDRDNTLIVSDGYLGDPAGVVLVEGAPEIVARMRTLGYAVVVFSNQSGVARGMFSEDDVRRVNSRLDELLVDHNPGAIVDRHEFCPFHPEGTMPQYAVESDLRKPKPGMILDAAEKLALDLSRSWVIGDAPRDIEAGQAAGCRTIWYKDSRLPPSSAAKELMLTVPDAVVSTLREAMDVIARDVLVRQASAPEVVPESAPIAASSQPRESRVQSSYANPPLSNTEEDTKEAVAVATARTAAASGSNAPDRPKPWLAAKQRVPVAAAVVDEPPVTEAASSLEMEEAPMPSSMPETIPPGNGARPGSAREAIQTLAAERKPRTTANAPIDTVKPIEPLASPHTAPSMARLEDLAEQILQRLQRQHTPHDSDFSISKLLAGITQIVAIATLLLAYIIYRHDPVPVLLAAVFLQVLTVSLLIMGRQR